MSFAIAPDGVRIHCEVEGSGPSLVLQHGLFRNLNNWHERGYVERFAPRYQWILIDSWGHGESDKPDNAEAYELGIRVVDVASVLHDAGADTAHYMGYSVGCWIGYGISIYMPQRFRSLTLGSSAPTLSTAPNWETVVANPTLRENPQIARSLVEFPHAMPA
jgi:pimeloyl-ACP methyl ester carboxylesterase